jgi:hypothetical protein
MLGVTDITEDDPADQRPKATPGSEPGAAEVRPV